MVPKPYKRDVIDVQPYVPPPKAHFDTDSHVGRMGFKVLRPQSPVGRLNVQGHSSVELVSGPSRSTQTMNDLVHPIPTDRQTPICPIQEHQLTALPVDSLSKHAPVDAASVAVFQQPACAGLTTASNDVNKSRMRDPRPAIMAEQQAYTHSSPRGALPRAIESPRSRSPICKAQKPERKQRRKPTAGLSHHMITQSCEIKYTLCALSSRGEVEVEWRQPRLSTGRTSRRARASQQEQKTRAVRRAR